MSCFSACLNWRNTVKNGVEYVAQERIEEWGESSFRFISVYLHTHVYMDYRQI